ncbi:MAG: Chitin synthase, class 5 [Bathelium mastoideum]|nr:MAG: Chitin synthase, class 5 [Bathelium mastoideum]KAI9693370.1 MAG: Chitin synthase, class 5 [Bathelium mastoideum]
MLVSLTVGKVDAGVAVLLTEDKRLIEFPSILLPPDIASGSIVDITVARNFTSESSASLAFARLQADIYSTFGVTSPSPPVLRCRNATQTSIVLEWDPIQLATAELRSLSLYRNGSKAGSIPRPLEQHSTKISGLPPDTEYTFHLVLRTSAGTYSSEKLVVHTHKMTDLSGITITPGVMPAVLKESLQATVERIGSKIIDTVRIDTTHFVCTEGRGREWERAVEMNVPVVVPDWIKGCEREGRLVGVRGYYLNADPRLRQVGQGVGVQQQAQQQHPQARQEGSRQGEGQRSQQDPQSPLTTPSTQVIPPTPEQARPGDEGERTNGSETPPPPPPPKFEDQDEDHAETNSKDAGGEGHLGLMHGKNNISAAKSRTEEHDDNDGDDDEDDEEEEESVDEKSAEADATTQSDYNLPVRGKPYDDADPSEGEDEGRYEEVAL